MKVTGFLVFVLISAIHYHASAHQPKDGVVIEEIEQKLSLNSSIFDVVYRIKAYISIENFHELDFETSRDVNITYGFISCPWCNAQWERLAFVNCRIKSNSKFVTMKAENNYFPSGEYTLDIVGRICTGPEAKDVNSFVRIHKHNVPRYSRSSIKGKMFNSQKWFAPMLTNEHVVSAMETERESETNDKDFIDTFEN